MFGKIKINLITKQIRQNKIIVTYQEANDYFAIQVDNKACKYFGNG
jgi:hypothetical protein